MSATAGLRLGDASDSSITVNGALLANSAYVYPLVTLMAQAEDASVTFATASSTFHTLAAQADNGVTVQVDVTATTGTLYLDGDYENSSTEDSKNDLDMANDVGDNDVERVEEWTVGGVARLLSPNSCAVRVLAVLLDAAGRRPLPVHLVPPQSCCYLSHLSYGTLKNAS